MLMRWRPSGDAAVEIKCQKCKEILVVTGYTVSFTDEESRLAG